MNGSTNSLGGGGNHILQWNSNYTYKVKDLCVYNGHVWRCDKSCTNITPGTNYNYWNVTYSNKNLLDNWDFTNPVNQRGQTEYDNLDCSHTNGMTIDRWQIIDYHKVSIKDGYVLLTGSAQSNQYGQIIQNWFDDIKKVRGKTFTLSLKYYQSSSYSSRITAWFTTGVAGIDNSVTGTNTSGIISTTFTIPSNDTSAYVVIGNSLTKSYTEARIYAVKLEYGDISTLANDMLGVSYDEELHKCQYYYQRFTSSQDFSTFSTTNTWVGNGIVFGTLEMTRPMRKMPILSFKDAFLQIEDKSIRFVPNITSMTVEPSAVSGDLGTTSTTLKFMATYDSSGWSSDTSHEFCLVNLRNGGYIELNAEL